MILDTGKTIPKQFSSWKLPCFIEQSWVYSSMAFWLWQHFVLKLNQLAFSFMAFTYGIQGLQFWVPVIFLLYILIWYAMILDTGKTIPKQFSSGKLTCFIGQSWVYSSMAFSLWQHFILKLNELPFTFMAFTYGIQFWVPVIFWRHILIWYEMILDYSETIPKQFSSGKSFSFVAFTYGI
jgi:hypothetical protein